MGKKAKLRKKRREQTANGSAVQPTNSDDFIGQIEKTGYRKENVMRSPEVPRDEIEPIV
ncbi:hypothetical protein Xen7305DRAFT_00044040 [Xenococcus sp. PCC 7305]|uniref:hypothetical protein n=1 Tax=Xenococcus sp. PCC 7305 TaxID=102125 RepID=UPI0002AC2265|nr:hypothetical protein [Xenococcus sp. PCC 7305]ELS04668.1 hypothetical protein Xen7305DRAFT_00044040 [Xenococcus sp. PCC 7305]